MKKKTLEPEGFHRIRESVSYWMVCIDLRSTTTTTTTNSTTTLKTDSQIWEAPSSSSGGTRALVRTIFRDQVLYSRLGFRFHAEGVRLWVQINESWKQLRLLKERACVTQLKKVWSVFSFRVGSILNLRDPRVAMLQSWVGQRKGHLLDEARSVAYSFLPTCPP